MVLVEILRIEVVELVGLVDRSSPTTLVSGAYRPGLATPRTPAPADDRLLDDDLWVVAARVEGTASSRAAGPSTFVTATLEPAQEQA